MYNNAISFLNIFENQFR